MMRKYSSIAFAAALVAAVACGREESGDLTSSTTPNLDTRLRATLQQWGAVPIGAVTPPSPALVDLGKALFFDRVLSGNRDVSCATCHSPLNHTADVLALSIGTGGTTFVRAPVATSISVITSGASPARTNVRPALVSV